MSLPRVRIAAPIRNRAWILPEYLKRIEDLDYPSGLLSYHWLFNDCTDDSVGVVLKSNLWTIVERMDFGRKEPDERTAASRAVTYGILAQLRQRIFDQTLADGIDYLLCIDSDVLVPDYTLNHLLGPGKDIIAALIQNGPGDCYNYLLEDESGFYRDDKPPTGLMQVGATGACCLYTRKAMLSGKWQSNPQGEDIGFAISLRGKDVSLWVNTDTKATHIMSQEQLKHGN